jgi:hypothetical protein
MLEHTLQELSFRTPAICGAFVLSFAKTIKHKAFKYESSRKKWDFFDKFSRYSPIFSAIPTKKHRHQFLQKT